MVRERERVYEFWENISFAISDMIEKKYQRSQLFYFLMIIQI